MYLFSIDVSCQLFANNFANIRCTDVKFTFLECTPKITSDTYTFVNFFSKKRLIPFLFCQGRKGITRKVLEVITWFQNILCKTFVALTHLRTISIITKKGGLSKMH